MLRIWKPPLHVLLHYGMGVVSGCGLNIVTYRSPRPGEPVGTRVEVAVPRERTREHGVVGKRLTEEIIHSLYLHTSLKEVALN